MKQYYIYIITNKRNGTLYIGVTSDLIKRLYEHKLEIVKGFTQKYHLHTLVYYESTEDVFTAIEREKELKRWHREWKIKLIESKNPFWEDLRDYIVK